MSRAETMRLIDCKTGRLVDFSGRRKPPYAILSHCWMDDEMTYANMSAFDSCSGSGFRKVKEFVKVAKKDGLRWAWIDTCCVNKQAINELTETINSMYKWYHRAERCYVFLHDVHLEAGHGDLIQQLSSSRWFTRGWTLQELVAPQGLRTVFFNSRWEPIGDRVALAGPVAAITGIPREVLISGDIRSCSVAQRMSWAANRQTTRIEDEAYCLLGLFGISMPLLYGEGRKAFIRLQEEIIKEIDDHSIFAWSMGRVRFSGLLATRTACFAHCRDVCSITSRRGRSAFSMTNRGLSIELDITPWSADTYLAFLDCIRLAPPDTGHRGRLAGIFDFEAQPENDNVKTRRIGLFLRRLREDDQYARINLDGRQGVFDDIGNIYHQERRPIEQRRIFVRKHIEWSEEEDCLSDRVYGYRISRRWLPHHAGSKIIHSDPDLQHATLPDGAWNQVIAIDITVRNKPKRIIMGFDFDFNPVILLIDFSDGMNSRISRNSLNWSFDAWNMDPRFWRIIPGESNIYRNVKNNGMWALRGDRLDGLEIYSWKPTETFVTIVNLQRRGSPDGLAWEIEFDGLHAAFEKLAGDGNMANS